MTAERAGAEIGRVHHRPYPLRRADVLSLAGDMLQPNGMPLPASEPLALYSPGVDVDVFALRDVR